MILLRLWLALVPRTKTEQSSAAGSFSTDKSVEVSKKHKVTFLIYFLDQMYQNQLENCKKVSTWMLSKISTISNRTFVQLEAKAFQLKKRNLMKSRNSGSFTEYHLFITINFSDPKSTSEESEIEEIEVIEEEETDSRTKSSCESKHWNFCTKCRAAWYKSESTFLLHPCPAK